MMVLCWSVLPGRIQGQQVLAYLLLQLYLLLLYFVTVTAVSDIVSYFKIY